MLRASSICLWLGAFVFESGVFCQNYVTFSALSLPEIAKGTFPTSINKKGEIAGYYIAAPGDTGYGFVRDPGGTITSFDWPGSDSPGAHSTVVGSINDEGAITGYSYAPPSISPNPPLFQNHGFVRDPEGNFTTFDPPGSANTQASVLSSTRNNIKLESGTQMVLQVNGSIQP